MLLLSSFTSVWTYITCAPKSVSTGSPYFSVWVTTESEEVPGLDKRRDAFQPTLPWFCFCLYLWCPISFLQPLSFLEVFQGWKLLRDGLWGADVSELEAPKPRSTSCLGISHIVKQDTHWRTIQLPEIKKIAHDLSGHMPKNLEPVISQKGCWNVLTSHYGPNTLYILCITCCPY